MLQTLSTFPDESSFISLSLDEPSVINLVINDLLLMNAQ